MPSTEDDDVGSSISQAKYPLIPFRTVMMNQAVLKEQLVEIYLRAIGVRVNKTTVFCHSM